MDAPRPRDLVEPDIYKSAIPIERSINLEIDKMTKMEDGQGQGQGKEYYDIVLCLAL